MTAQEQALLGAGELGMLRDLLPWIDGGRANSSNDPTNQEATRKSHDTRINRWLIICGGLSSHRDG